MHCVVCLSGPRTTDVQLPVPAAMASSSDCATVTAPGTSVDECVVSSRSRLCDVGILYDNDTLQRKLIAQFSDEQKTADFWMPPADFEWPFFQKAKQRVYLRHNHTTGRHSCFKFPPTL